MQNLQNRKSVWEQKHNNKDKGALSGCVYAETVDFLQIRDLVQSEANVLEIGVGFGYVTEALSKLCTVSALDISEVALRRVSGYCLSTYLVEKIETLPADSFDLIICHNVIQHVPTNLLKAEFKHVIASLKSTGVLAVEFISSKDVVDDGDVQEVNGIGNYSRTSEFMKLLFSELGGNSVMVVDNKCNIGNITGCHVFHIRKK
jgi:2-polyprenyl-3-methyl-5-hydroxy-6-metoxy-1,4-benzoquinol methylase